MATPPSWRSGGDAGWPPGISQSRAVPSLLPVNARRPSGAIATARTDDPCCRRSPSGLPVVQSQRRADPSSHPTRAIRPLGSLAIEVTAESLRRVRRWGTSVYRHAERLIRTTRSRSVESAGTCVRASASPSTPSTTSPRRQLEIFRSIRRLTFWSTAFCKAAASTSLACRSRSARVAASRRARISSTLRASAMRQRSAVVANPRTRVKAPAPRSAAAAGRRWPHFQSRSPNEVGRARIGSWFR